jgi:(p)ppGpp synthase/HD superfamily hydrolase
MGYVTVLTERFDRALLYATHVHGGQVRKGTSTPYVAHLLAVAATVLEYGGDEELAIAALLHDSVEDQGGNGRWLIVAGAACYRRSKQCTNGQSA